MMLASSNMLTVLTGIDIPLNDCRLSALKLACMVLEDRKTAYLLAQTLMRIEL